MSYSLVKPGIYGGNTSGYDIRINETFDSQTLEIAQKGLAYPVRALGSLSAL